MTGIKVCTLYYSIIVQSKYLDTANISTQMLSIVIGDTNYSIKLKQKNNKHVFRTIIYSYKIFLSIIFLFISCTFLKALTFKG